MIMILHIEYLHHWCVHSFFNSFACVRFSCNQCVWISGEWCTTATVVYSAFESCVFSQSWDPTLAGAAGYERLQWTHSPALCSVTGIWGCDEDATGDMDAVRIVPNMDEQHKDVKEQYGKPFGSIWKCAGFFWWIQNWRELPLQNRFQLWKKVLLIPDLGHVAHRITLTSFTTSTVRTDIWEQLLGIKKVSLKDGKV